jgi:ferredoxin-NADP reductase
MIQHSISLWLGITFVLVGAANVWLILQVSARVRDARAGTRLIAAHRTGGYTFIALFCAMGYFMISRMGAVADGAPPGAMIHFTLAMVLSPLLFVKVLVARYYKAYHSVLTPLGLVIFVLAFVLVGIAVAPVLSHRVTMQTVSLEAIDLPPAAIDMEKAGATMERRCSKCHNLDRIVGARKDVRGWLATVDRMKALPGSGISEADSRMIVSYLASQMAIRGSVAAQSLGAARALVDQRCGRCHGLDRVYKTAETPGEWSATVSRMAAYAAGNSGAFHPGEVQQIVDYLSATQTPDAVNRRKAAVAAPSSGSRSVEKREASSAPDQPLARSQYDRTGIAFISLVCLGALTLIIRRPARVPPASAKSEIPSTQDAGVSRPIPVILRLASITRQTPDAKTLRFIVPHGRMINARPGQFLTFTFLFDGKKIDRPYSICSSPARSGYIEITPKRISQGCVSVFLNDRAHVGMAVEVSGAFGHFFFDESKHQNVVLLAAGSGITPMMAMLRYMDDLCLETTVTLLYCVRTVDDIMFHEELAELRGRLKNFQYHLLLSQPQTGWSGPSGRVSREFVESNIQEIALQDFFLCGPPPFMDASRAILSGLGVKPERIRQESFGNSVPQSAQPVSVASETELAVEFARSGRTCAVRSGQTLLEAAEEHGVAISSSCRQGQCGTCKTKLLAGKIRMETQEGLLPDWRMQGFVLPCVGHAETAVKLDA